MRISLFSPTGGCVRAAPTGWVPALLSTSRRAGLTVRLAPTATVTSGRLSGAGDRFGYTDPDPDAAHEMRLLSGWQVSDQRRSSAEAP